MKINTVACAAFLVFASSVFAADTATKPEKATVVSSGLAKKLVDGSPWRLTTGRVTHTHHFRMSDEGKLQRLAPATGKWGDLEVSEAQTASFELQNGKIVSIYLKTDGVPDVTYSGGVAQLKSIKE